MPAPSQQRSSESLPRMGARGVRERRNPIGPNGLCTAPHWDSIKGRPNRRKYPTYARPRRYRPLFRQPERPNESSRVRHKPAGTAQDKEKSKHCKWLRAFEPPDEATAHSQDRSVALRPNCPRRRPRSHLARDRSIPHKPHTADPGQTPFEAARTLLGRREELPAKLSRTTIPKPFQQRPKAFVIHRSANQPRAHGFPCPKESPAPVTVVKKVRLATNVAIHSQQWKTRRWKSSAENWK